MTAFDSWSVPCPRCRAAIGQPCRLAWWSRQREHAARFSRAWRLQLRPPALVARPRVPYSGGPYRCPRCLGAAERAADFPTFVICSGGAACFYVYAAPSRPVFQETPR